LVYKDKLCKCGCGKTGKIWSKGMLKQCFFRLNPVKPIKKSSLSKILSPKAIIKKEEKKERTKRLHAWFISEIWEKRPHYSELSLKWLGNEPNTCFFHHIYSKSSHPDLEFIADNIIQLTADEHAEVEANSTKFHLINTKREEIRIKYGK